MIMVGTVAETCQRLGASKFELGRAMSAFGRLASVCLVISRSWPRAAEVLAQLHPSPYDLTSTNKMATPVILGVGAIAAAIAGRSLLRRGAQAGADQWVKGGFKARMDRKEAVAILGLK